MSVTVRSDNTKQFVSSIGTAIDRALEKIGLTAEGYAKDACPVGTPESTGIPGYVGGTLRNSITHSVNNGEKAVYIGTNVEYAPFVELGTSRKAERPYLRPAAQNHQAQYRQIIEKELKNG